MSFGERLRAIRQKNGMNQEEFAFKMNVTRQTVSKWEVSGGYPEIEKLIFICNYFGTTLNDLFVDELSAEPTKSPMPHRKNFCKHIT